MKMYSWISSDPRLRYRPHRPSIGPGACFWALPAISGHLLALVGGLDLPRLRVLVDCL